MNACSLLCNFLSNQSVFQLKTIHIPLDVFIILNLNIPQLHFVNAYFIDWSAFLEVVICFLSFFVCLSVCLSVCLCVKVARQQLQTKYRSIPNFFFFPFFSRPRFPSIFNSNLQYGNRFVEPFSLLDYIKEYKATLYFIHNRKVLNMATPSPNTFTDALFYFSVSPSYIIIVTLSVSLS